MPGKKKKQMSKAKCPACGGEAREILGIEREVGKDGKETGRIRPVIKYVACYDCGRKQKPVKVTPTGDWYYPAAI